MPIIVPGGDLVIVAHQDDDILFMNPDLANSIDAGVPVTTVFLTAGDAGLGTAYWEGREAGAKAAYALMSGSDDWVDETQTVVSGGTEFEIATSYLDSDPDVRLYFMRLPDGAGLLEPEDQQLLARLQTGTIDAVGTVDGSAVYSREDVVNVLSEIMDLHEPAQFRLQIAEGDYASGEHTDHLQTAVFAREALDQYEGGDYTVTSYVQYQSSGLPENLSAIDAARSLEIMQAYAEYDLAVLNGDGTLQQVYVDWTGRQYVAEQYQVGAAPASVSGRYFADIDDNGLDDDEVGIEGAQVTLFRDGTELAQTTTDATGGYAFTGLTAGTGYSVGFEDPTAVLDETGVSFVTSGPDSDVSANGLTAGFDLAEGETLSGIDAGVAGLEPAPEPPEEPAPPPPAPPADATFLLSGPDSFLFDIDTETGEVSPKDWFSPSLGDAWDQNEDYIYEVIRTAIPDDGSPQQDEALRFDTTAEGVLTQIAPDGTPVPGDPGDPPEDPVDPDPIDDPVEPDPIDDPVDPDPIDDPVEPDPIDPSPPDIPVDTAVLYCVDGPDSLLFAIDETSGTITTKDWFTPTYDDAWDVDEDHIYEITRIGRLEDGQTASSEEIRYEMTPDEEFRLIPSGEALMSDLALSPEGMSAGEADFAAMQEAESAEAETEAAMDLVS